MKAPRDEPTPPRGSTLPSLSRIRARGAPRPSRRALARAAALVAVHLAILVHLAHWRVAERTLSPLEPSEAMQTLELGYVNAGFVLLVATLLLTLILGRFFCGWACHVVAYQDLCAWLLGKLGLRPRPVRSRLLALVPLGAAFYMFAWPSLERALAGGAPPAFVAHLTTDDFWASFPGPGVAALTLLVDGFLIVWLLGSKGFCTYGCPYGALFGLADRVAPGRIRVDERCDGCAQCTSVCTSNVRVHEEVARHGMVVDSGCMKCLDCVSSCPKEALRFGLGAPRPLRSGPRRAWDFSWGEELALAVVFGLALYAFRGLYRLVPFLLALGLAVLCAVVAAALWRTLRQPSLRFQHLQLRSDGRLRASGAAFLGLGAGLLALAAHSGWVQYNAREGERLLGSAQQLPTELRAPTLERSYAHLLAAERVGLLPVAALQLQLGSIEGALGRRSAAERRYRRALELDPTLRAPRLALADLRILSGDLAGAEALLRELLTLDPGNAAAQARLQRLQHEARR